MNERNNEIVTSPELKYVNRKNVLRSISFLFGISYFLILIIQIILTSIGISNVDPANGQSNGDVFNTLMLVVIILVIVDIIFVLLQDVFLIFSKPNNKHKLKQKHSKIVWAHLWTSIGNVILLIVVIIVFSYGFSIVLIDGFTDTLVALGATLLIVFFVFSVVILFVDFFIKLVYISFEIHFVKKNILND